MKINLLQHFLVYSDGDVKVEFWHGKVMWLYVYWCDIESMSVVMVPRGTDCLRTVWELTPTSYKGRIFIKPDVLMFGLFESNGIFEAHLGNN